ncbi:hypothetical protein GWK47_046083 [Chionoecetes opilio]|uniref:Uncharacterized protein n=1 Tax=Chionoecetes opilio TaxID=41210 RepID=A0A8J5CXC1_CHIOP|nr:hypothetical protein GWK47_046083 [Chionoecetes opilio]
MEYSPLAWSSCPPSYLGLLDRVQARAQRLARLKAPEAAAQIIQLLQQRRDVAGMCVMYKAHRMQLLQLAELRLNPRARPFHSTRAAHNIDHQVTVPFARTEHYIRSFLPRYGRLWNTLVRQTDLHLTTSLHAFKSGGGLTRTHVRQAIHSNTSPTPTLAEQRLAEHSWRLKVRNHRAPDERFRQHWRKIIKNRQSHKMFTVFKSKDDWVKLLKNRYRQHTRFGIENAT